MTTKEEQFEYLENRIKILRRMTIEINSEYNDFYLSFQRHITNLIQTLNTLEISLEKLKNDN